MIYLLTAIGLSPGGRSTVHIYTQTIHGTIQNKQYTEQHNNLGAFVEFYGANASKTCEEKSKIEIMKKMIKPKSKK
jgi:hypothetical protein